MIALAVLAVALVPAIDALTTPLGAAALHEARTAQRFLLAGKMAELLAEPYGALSAEASTPGSPTASTAYSDTAGTPNRRLVYITAWDADNADADNDPFTGTDANILWLRVEIEGEAFALEALTAS